MWGAQEKSEGAHQKNSAGASRRHCAPHLQIASDANATYQLAEIDIWTFRHTNVFSALGRCGPTLVVSAKA